MYLFIKDFVIKSFLASYAFIFLLSLMQVYTVYYEQYSPDCGYDCASYWLIVMPSFVAILVVVSLVIEHMLLHVKFTHVELVANYFVSILISVLAMNVSGENFWLTWTYIIFTITSIVSVFLTYILARFTRVFWALEHKWVKRSLILLSLATIIFLFLSTDSAYVLFKILLLPHFPL